MKEVRECPICKDPMAMRIEFFSTGFRKYWLKSTCLKCGRSWEPEETAAKPVDIGDSMREGDHASH